MSCPEDNFKDFMTMLSEHAPFQNMEFKMAVEDDGKSFQKLIVKVRPQLVTDGLSTNDYDVTNVGKHLSAAEWNTRLENEDVICVDVRNSYESEIGHFKNAILPKAEFA